MTKVRLVAGACGLGLLMSGAPLVPGRSAPVLTAAAATAPGLTLSARDHATGRDGIYVADSDGTTIRNLRKITPDDGRDYSWGRFAFGNTKLVYTVRKGPVSSPEDIGLMDLDGSNARVLRHFNYRVAQPIIDRTGRWLHYTAMPPFFPVAAQYRMDLVTGLSTNITAVGRPTGGFDADPFLTDDGSKLLFVENDPGTGALIGQMNPDGTDRTSLTTSTWFDTDPAVSRDGSQIAIASYRGRGSQAQADPSELARTAAAESWHITLQPRRAGRDLVLTEGVNCTLRTSANPCQPKEMSGFLPRFTPDQSSVAFVGALDQLRTCICAVSTDGSNARVLFETSDLAISWQDWPQPSGYAERTDLIGSENSGTRLLTVMSGPGDPPQLVTATPDLAFRETVVLPPGLIPIEARWGPDRATIVFSARTDVGSPQSPHPAAPAGQARRSHTTLSAVDALAPSPDATDTAEQQVFLRTPDGTVRQLTDPWIEDWRDGLAEGDARGNSQPRMSADGRYVTVTNTSTTTGESFLLRIDVHSGEVLNLTNGTAGAVATDDADPAPSPDGRLLAFAWTEQGQRGIYLMDSQSGLQVSELIKDRSAYGPAWSPDASFLAYVSAGVSGTTVFSADVRGGTASTPRVVSRGVASAWGPVVSPDGGQIAFISAVGPTVGLYITDAAGDQAPRPIQPDLVSNITSVDWK
jgi:Tol biopolymer transport system component